MWHNERNIEDNADGKSLLLWSCRTNRIAIYDIFRQTECKLYKYSSCFWAQKTKWGKIEELTKKNNRSVCRRINENGLWRKRFNFELSQVFNKSGMANFNRINMLRRVCTEAKR